MKLSWFPLKIHKVSTTTTITNTFHNRLIYLFISMYTFGLVEILSKYLSMKLSRLMVIHILVVIRPPRPDRPPKICLEYKLDSCNSCTRPRFYSLECCLVHKPDLCHSCIRSYFTSESIFLMHDAGLCHPSTKTWFPCLYYQALNSNICSLLFLYTAHLCHGIQSLCDHKRGLTLQQLLEGIKIPCLN